MVDNHTPKQPQDTEETPVDDS
jgi:hypothetical protein